LYFWFDKPLKIMMKSAQGQANFVGHREWASGGLAGAPRTLSWDILGRRTKRFSGACKVVP
jgi:hypothetical protein